MHLHHMSPRIVGSFKHLVSPRFWTRCNSTNSTGHAIQVSRGLGRAARPLVALSILPIINDASQVRPKKYSQRQSSPYAPPTRIPFRGMWTVEGTVSNRSKVAKGGSDQRRHTELDHVADSSHNEEANTDSLGDLEKLLLISCNDRLG